MFFSCEIHVVNVVKGWLVVTPGQSQDQSVTETGPGRHRQRYTEHSAQPVHLVMRHKHNSVSAFIILEILIRKEKVNCLAGGVLKISSAYVLFWLLLTDSTLSRWSAEQKPRHLPKRNLVSTTSTQYFYFDHPHTLRSLHLQQQTTNMG